MISKKKKLIVILAIFFLLGFTSKGFGGNKDLTKGPGWAQDEIIVKFKLGVPEDVINNINKKNGTTQHSISKRGGFRRVKIPSNKTVEEMVNIYNQNPDVEYAEANVIYNAHTADTYYEYQWHLDNPVYGGINMECAWAIQTGNNDVIVAVIDSGVAYENNLPSYIIAPDLANTCFVAGRDFVNNDDHPNDDNAHGTHVTGTIAQSTNNELGTAGVAYNTCIMPIKVLNRNGSGYVTDIADGISWAADHGAEVINMSLGGPLPSTTLKNACQDAYEAGVTIVVSSGNSGPETLSYPAAYDAYVIAVGATRYDEAISNYSSYYSDASDPTIGQYVDITAPGGDVTVDQNEDGYVDGVLQQTFARKQPLNMGYYFYQGTSMAAPHVAGVAALLIANGVNGPDNVREALENTAEKQGFVGWDAKYGYGIVDACAALAYTSTPECTVDGDCDDDSVCNGAETCNDDGTCQAGTALNCDNGDWCDGAETCDATSGCQEGTAPNCDDGVVCTVDSCNEDTDSCGHVPNDGYCDDELYCNGDETCDATSGCQDGSDPCPDEVCDEDSDSCIDCTIDADCADDSVCNGAETCNDGTCQAGTALNCDDGLYCNGAETCDATSGCQDGSDPCPDEVCDEGTDTCITTCSPSGDYCESGADCCSGWCHPAKNYCR